MNATVISVSKANAHRFSKTTQKAITLIAGVGVDGDAHAGDTVKHRSRVAVNPTTPNLRQVHLIHSELLDELNGKGFHVQPSDLGENITTRGIDLLSLPQRTLLQLGNEAIVEVTGLRNPCQQIERFRKGMLKEVLETDSTGRIIKKAGIMGVVKKAGTINVGDEITAILPDSDPIPLEGV